MKNLLEYLLIHLVQFPEDVKVEEKEENGIFEYLITVNPEDMARVIGKKGSVINSIRAIAKVRAVKDSVKVNVKLVD